MKSPDEKAEERAAWHRITGSPDCEFIRAWLKAELAAVVNSLLDVTLDREKVEIFRGRGIQLNDTLRKFEPTPHNED